MLGLSAPADYRDDISTVDDPTLATTHLDARADVAVAVVLAGSPDLLNLLAARDGRSRLDRTAAAGHCACLLIMHGTRDRTVPISLADSLHQMCAAAGISHEYDRLEGVGHNFIYEDLADETFRKVYQFVVDQLGLSTDVINERAAIDS